MQKMHLGSMEKTTTKTKTPAKKYLAMPVDAIFLF